MGFTSIWHWLIVLVIVLLLFGAGKLPKVMGDLAKGIKNFKAGLKDEGDDAAAQAPAQPSIPAQPAQPAPAQPTQAQPAPAQPAAQTQAPAQPAPGQQP